MPAWLGGRIESRHLFWSNFALVTISKGPFEKSAPTRTTRLPTSPAARVIAKWASGECSTRGIGSLGRANERSTPPRKRCTPPPGWPGGSSSPCERTSVLFRRECRCLSAATAFVPLVWREDWIQTVPTTAPTSHEASCRHLPAPRRTSFLSSCHGSTNPSASCLRAPAQGHAGIFTCHPSRRPQAGLPRKRLGMGTASDPPPLTAHHRQRRAVATPAHTSIFRGQGSSRMLATNALPR
ncbi:hypothetical protein B0T11DRAFT_1163 [Plectosphaerella cucumerina]|uniref:Uncharacterized protein n=1 Tax=Plectosphaerella cucumerina TaxID=40658 RepID=A0A8K0TQP8_9PEZI|nr:hypothetical protein B0T11DRAFT_1163 [Plectosphaerella cucumerina]